MRSRERIATAVGGCALAVAVFAIGGAPRWAILLLAVLAAGAVATQILSRRRFERPAPLLWFLGMAAGLTLLQVLPLPAAVLAAVNPTGAELVADRRALLGVPGGLVPLSMDPPNSRRALLELVVYLGLGWTALRIAAKESGRLLVVTAVALSCGAAAAIGLVSYVAGATALYGLYTPSQASPTFVAPLLNSNHFACLMALGAPLAGALAMYGRSPRNRLMWGLLALLCLGMGLLTRSRGGVGAMATGMTVLALILALQRWMASGEIRRRNPIRVTLPAAIIVTCILTLVVYVSASGVGQDLDETSLTELADPRSKYAAWRSSLTLIDESPWLGIGRGAFEPAFTRVHPASAHATFAYLENEYLQVVVDWGLVGAGLLAAALAWLVLTALRRWNSGPLAAGALGAVAAVAVQSVVDFGVELPGLAVPLVLVLATLTYVPLREIRHRRGAILARGALVAAIAAMAIAVALPSGRTLADDHDRMRAESPPSAATARDAMIRHPLDYVAPTHAARTVRNDPRRAIALINDALVRHPTHPHLHRVVARLLVQTGHRGQAALEYELAMRGTRAPAGLVEEILAAFPEAAMAASAMPPDHMNLTTIVRTLRNRERIDVAQAYLERVVEARPHDPNAWQYLIDAAEARGDSETAERAARRRATLEPTLSSTTALARILAKRKRLAEAEAVLAPVEKLPGATADQVVARLVLCDVYIGQSKWPSARQCLQSLRDAPALRPEMRREIHARMAQVEDALGNKRRAEFERKQAGQR